MENGLRRSWNQAKGRFEKVARGYKCVKAEIA
jgi:hypothetical protein